MERRYPTVRKLFIIAKLLQKNYFEHNNTQYAHVDGLAIGAPTSSMFSGIYV
jgi:hypothetical protein